MRSCTPRANWRRTAARFPIDKIGAAAEGPLWFQLYAADTEEKNRELVETAVAAGCRAIALTVDVQYTSHRERVLHDRNLGAAPLTVNRSRTRRGTQPPS